MPPRKSKLPGSALILDDELGATAPCNKDFASRAWDVVSRRLSTTEHFSSVSHLFIVDAVHQPVGKCVTTEIAPKIPTATNHLPIPIDLRSVPELMADFACEFFSVLLLILFTGDRSPPGLAAHELRVADG